MSESKRTLEESELDEQQHAQSKSPGGAPGDAADAAAADVAADAAAGNGGRTPEAAEAAAELQVEVDLDELGALAAKRDEYLALAQRTQADFENYRKRVARDSTLAQERGVAKLAKELLPAIDNLDRALEAAANHRPAPGRPSPSDPGPGGTAEDSHLLDGVRLVRSELSAALARVGVESFSPLGETFDPAVHEAMATVPQPGDGGGAESGEVVEVYQPGYRLGETIIRPARVVVAA